MGLIMRANLFRQILSSLLIYLISAQMVLAKAPYRAPAAYGHDVEFEQLLKKSRRSRLRSKEKILNQIVILTQRMPLKMPSARISTYPIVDPNTILAENNTEIHFNSLMNNLKLMLVDNTFIPLILKLQQKKWKSVNLGIRGNFRQTHRSNNG